MTEAMQIATFSSADAREIKRRVLHSNRKIAGLPDHVGKEEPEWHYVILKEDLAPASNPLTGYTTAKAAVCMYLDGLDTLDMEEVATESQRIDILNRSPFISGTSGDIALVRWIVKEWAIVWCTSVSLRHGIVVSDLGCGYYTVELGVWTGDSYSSGVGIGSDVSSGMDRDCNICYDIEGSGTGDCRINLTYPPIQVTGTGKYVTAYHRASALVPLKVGTACMLSGSDADNPSDAPSSSDNVGVDRVWQIVDGLQVHTVQYIEEWSCCNSEGQTREETLLSRTPVIFAARVCDPIPCGTCYS